MAQPEAEEESVHLLDRVPVVDVDAREDESDAGGLDGSDEGLSELDLVDLVRADIEGRPHTGQGTAQVIEVVEVALRPLDVLREVGRPVGMANENADGCAGIEQRLRHRASDGAGRTDDEDGTEVAGVHGGAPGSAGVDDHLSGVSPSATLGRDSGRSPTTAFDGAFAYGTEWTESDRLEDDVGQLLRVRVRVVVRTRQRAHADVRGSRRRGEPVEPLPGAYVSASPAVRISGTRSRRSRASGVSRIPVRSTDHTPVSSRTAVGTTIELGGGVAAVGGDVAAANAAEPPLAGGEGRPGHDQSEPGCGSPAAARRPPARPATRSSGRARRPDR